MVFQGGSKDMHCWFVDLYLHAPVQGVDPRTSCCDTKLYTPAIRWGLLWVWVGSSWAVIWIQRKSDFVLYIKLIKLCVGGCEHVHVCMWCMYVKKKKTTKLVLLTPCLKSTSSIPWDESQVLFCRLQPKVLCPHTPLLLCTITPGHRRLPSLCIGSCLEYFLSQAPGQLLCTLESALNVLCPGSFPLSTLSSDSVSSAQGSGVTAFAMHYCWCFAWDRALPSLRIIPSG